MPTAYDIEVDAMTRGLRGKQIFRRRPLDQPCWHSLSCVCEECLDMDMIISQGLFSPGPRPLFAERTS